MSDKYKGKYRGQTFRLQNWDYGSEALYFITICTQNREHFFGEIENGEMILSEIGKIVESEWINTPAIRPDMNLELMEFVVMPNHFHAIIGIGANQYNEKNEMIDLGTVGILSGDCRDAMHCVPTIPRIPAIPQIPQIPAIPRIPAIPKNHFGPQSKNLSSIIRGFKSSVTTWCRKNNYPDFKWQSLFHDHIIRNQQAFENIQQYIVNNPKNWKEDDFRN